MKTIPVLTLALTLFAILPSTFAADARPNVLFIAADDMRPDLRCYGNKIVATELYDEMNGPAATVSPHDKPENQAIIAGLAKHLPPALAHGPENQKKRQTKMDKKAKASTEKPPAPSMTAATGDRGLRNDRLHVGKAKITLDEPSKPNIILVMPDDVGYGDYACLGNPILRTPSVDAFKKESLLFTQFHVSPTCAPTRSALMSGRHEFKNGVTHTILERERMTLKTYTLPQMLKTVGYTSGIFGKWHLGDEEAYRPENRGFDEVYIHGGGGIGQTYPGSCGDAPGNTNINPTLWHNGKFERTTGYCTDLFFAQATRWINEKREAKQPFFAYIPLNAAHGPHVVPEEYYKHYLDKPGVSQDTAKFLGMVENVDTNFGKLLARINEWGIADNTLVIYIGGDNGGTAGVKIFNAGMKDGKGTIYQGGTRAAGFFRWPAGGIPAGAECNALSAHIDLFPTLAEITGATLTAEVKQQVEGRSLLTVLKNPTTGWADRTLVHHVGRWGNGKAANSKFAKSAIQNSRFTLVNNAELYDLKADPGETKNVISEHPDVVATLRAAYDQWWTEVQPLLVNESVTDIPSINPFQTLYYTQFGGSPTPADLKRMNPDKTAGGDEAPAPRRKKAKANK